MTIYQLTADKFPTVDVQNGGKVGLYVRDDDHAGTPDEVHGFLLEPASAVAAAEELLAVAGEITGGEAAMTIWGEQIAIDVATYAGQPCIGLAITDRDHRTVRFAIPEDTAQRVVQQLQQLFGRSATNGPH